MSEHEPIELRLKAALLDAFTIEHGMGNPPGLVWETYVPEGVAIVLVNAVMPLLNEWAESLVRSVAREAASLALGSDPTSASPPPAPYPKEGSR